MKLDVSIENLKLPSEIIKRLRELSLCTIEDLWKCKRLFLKGEGFTDSEIHQIQIQLQLLSIDFNRKVYKY